MEDRILCFDSISGLYFYANANEITKKIHELQDGMEIMSDMISLTEFYGNVSKKFKRNEKGFKHKTHHKKKRA